MSQVIGKVLHLANQQALFFHVTFIKKKDWNSALARRRFLYQFQMQLEKASEPQHRKPSQRYPINAKHS